jgi:hypothetical protein
MAEELERQLLSGGRDVWRELNYPLEQWHVGLIAVGAGAERAVAALAARVGRQLLCLPHDGEMVWGWLGGGGRFGSLAEHRRSFPKAVRLAVGEPCWGMDGWRCTHRQAKAALLVLTRRSAPLVRYGDVALLANALQDVEMAQALLDIYIKPLQETRDGGRLLRYTLSAYFAAERNVSSTAKALGVTRNTVDSRLRAVERLLHRPLRPCPPELEVAIQLYELGM